MNSLEDRKIIAKLYEASAAGVDIDLIVRGLCCIRPGVPGKSERIRVISVIGRFLEHSRMFYFQNGAADPLDGEFYMGSTDWMYRNLLGRIEVVVPIQARSLRERCWEILQIMLRDQRQTWDLNPDGSYTQRMPKILPGSAQAGAAVAATTPEEAGTHPTLMELTRQRCALVST
jgi:polyphosphate kinase